MSRIDYNNPHGAGALGLPYHYEMVSDAERVQAFKIALQQVCQGKVVLESGTGTGLMALLAARAGARRVYATEIDPSIAAVARRNIAASGLDHVHLLPKSTLDVTLDDIGGERADVVIAENLSTWFVTEPEIQVMNHIDEHLAKPDAVRLPTHVDNTIELCSTGYRFEDLVELRAEYFEFTGVRQPRIMSDAVVAQGVGFDRRNPEQVELEVSLTATHTGIVDGVRLTSPLMVIPGVCFESSDSLMPPVIVPLERDLVVCAGDVVELRIRYETNTSWDRFSVTIASGPHA